MVSNLRLPEGIRLHRVHWDSHEHESNSDSDYRYLNFTTPIHSNSNPRFSFYKRFQKKSFFWFFLTSFQVLLYLLLCLWYICSQGFSLSCHMLSQTGSHLTVGAFICKVINTWNRYSNTYLHNISWFAVYTAHIMCSRGSRMLCMNGIRIICTSRVTTSFKECRLLYNHWQH